MVAADDDGRLDFAVPHHFVEGEAQPVALAEAHPADAGGKALEGSYFTNHYSPEGTDPKLKAFVKEYEAKYHAVPDSGVALAYDAAMILAEAMKRAKSLDNHDLRDAIAQTKNFPGVTGMITIDAKRNAQKPAVILKIEGGITKYLKTVAP